MALGSFSGFIRGTFYLEYMQLDDEMLPWSSKIFWDIYSENDWVKYSFIY